MGRHTRKLDDDQRTVIRCVLWLTTVVLLAIAALAVLVPMKRACAHEWYEPFADWFNSRRQPDSPTVGCCGVADAYYARSYAPSAEPGIAFRVTVEDKWGGPDWQIDVPVEKVDWASVNPTGRGVVYVSTNASFEGGGPPVVLCFIPGTGA